MSEELLIIPAYIASKKHAELLNRCVQSIRASTLSEIVVVDDCSPHSKQADVLYEYFEKNVGDISIIRKDKNEGFSKTVNIGINQAIKSDQNAVLVNADIEFVENDWLEVMRETDADIVGALLLYPNFVIQHAGIYFSSFTRNFDHRFKGAPPDLPAAHELTECPVTGALQYIKKEVFEKIGLYDEAFKMGYEDVDFMIRAIESGFKSVYNPEVKAIHHESVFRGSEDFSRWEKESYFTLVKKHADKDFFGIAPTMMESYEQS